MRELPDCLAVAGGAGADPGLLVLAVILIAGGAVAVALTWGRKRRTSGTLLVAALLAVGVGIMSPTGVTPAHAADCAPRASSPSPSATPTTTSTPTPDPSGSPSPTPTEPVDPEPEPEPTGPSIEGASALCAQLDDLLPSADNPIDGLILDVYDAVDGYAPADVREATALLRAAVLADDGRTEPGSARDTPEAEAAQATIDGYLAETCTYVDPGNDDPGNIRLIVEFRFPNAQGGQIEFHSAYANCIDWDKSSMHGNRRALTEFEAQEKVLVVENAIALRDGLSTCKFETNVINMPYIQYGSLGEILSNGVVHWEWSHDFITEYPYTRWAAAGNCFPGRIGQCDTEKLADTGYIKYTFQPEKNYTQLWIPVQSPGSIYFPDEETYALDVHPLGDLGPCALARSTDHGTDWVQDEALALSLRAAASPSASCGDGIASSWRIDRIIQTGTRWDGQPITRVSGSYLIDARLTAHEGEITMVTSCAPASTGMCGSEDGWWLLQ